MNQYTLPEAAKRLGIGQRHLRKLMRRHGWLNNENELIVTKELLDAELLTEEGAITEAGIGYLAFFCRR
ncbi:MAG: hypothetical protein KDK41_15300 [Leptospiraceae bacterium]|nr:hypothetical protein [Leptospiraceae bacterium]